MVAAETTQRARTLWLRAACSREQLFTLSERLSWSCVAALGMPLLLLYLLVCWLLPQPVDIDWRCFLVAMVAPPACGLYLGLMTTHGRKLGDRLAAAFVLVIGWGYLFRIVVAGGPIPPTGLALLVAELLCAGVFRWLAHRRWRNLDWLRCRAPPRAWA
jgi:hypothetical protein